MKAIGIVFLYDRSLGAPAKVAKEFSEYFSDVTEDLVKSNLLSLTEVKEIIDLNRIYWGGIKENFYEILEDDRAIGGLAIEVFEGHSNLKAADDVKSLIYDEKQVPWKFKIAVCILYE